MSWTRKTNASAQGNYSIKEERAQKLGIYPDELAAMFCELDDELQTDFFVEVAKKGLDFPNDQMQQWYAVGRHLKTCECSSEQAREMIKAIYHGVC